MQVAHKLEYAVPKRIVLQGVAELDLTGEDFVSHVCRRVVSAILGSFPYPQLTQKSLQRYVIKSHRHSIFHCAMKTRLHVNIDSEVVFDRWDSLSYYRN